MTTIKVWECGGKYSSYQFIPCMTCPRRHEVELCREILANVGFQQIHEEWWTKR